MIQIAIVNESTKFKDADLPGLVAALQIQVTRDFGTIYNCTAQILQVATGGKPPAGAWVLALLDNADQAGALGYHDVTPDGLPLGKSFIETTLSDGGLVSVTTSHELLEMLADPDINMTAEFDDATGRARAFYAYEVCDACEADSLGYVINGVTVSDFVFPAWFQGFRRPGSTQFDFQKKITNPFKLLPGGYISYFQVRGGGWQQLTADRDPKTLRASRGHVGSRRERRRTSREQWTASTYTPGKYSDLK